MNRGRKIFTIMLAFVCIVSGCSTMGTQKSADSVSASAGTYHSPFGFSIDLPSHWLVVSKEELKDNPDIINFEGEEFKDINKEILDFAKNIAVSGMAEVYINTITSNSIFDDNIVVAESIGDVPKTYTELNQFCVMHFKRFSEIVGKPINVCECELSRVAGLDSFYTIYDGIIDGIKTIQYHIQKSPSVVIVLTVSSKNETFEIIKKELDEMMSSLTMD